MKLERKKTIKDQYLKISGDIKDSVIILTMNQGEIKQDGEEVTSDNLLVALSILAKKFLKEGGDYRGRAR